MSIKKFEASGHIFALRLVGPNNVIGEVPLYEEGTKTYVFNAIAREDCSVYCIRYDLLEDGHCKRPFVVYCDDENLYSAYATTTGKIPRLAVIRQEGSILLYLVALGQ